MEYCNEIKCSFNEIESNEIKSNLLNFRMSQVERCREGVYVRPEIKFRFVMKKALFTLLFIANEMKCNFVSGVTG